MGLHLFHSASTFGVNDLAPSPSSDSASSSSETVRSFNTATAASLVAQVASFAGSHRSINELFENSWTKGKLPSKTLSPRVSEIHLDKHPSTTSRPEQDRKHEPAFYDAYNAHSRMAHMGVLDPSYDVFASAEGHGALVYKVSGQTAVVTGDPLCSPAQLPALLGEFRRREQRRLRLAFMGVGREFAEFAGARGWTTMLFGRERVLNPMTNKVLLQAAGKRTVAQSRRLMDPKRVGITAALYSPGTEGRDAALEAEIQGLYDRWRGERNSKTDESARAFVTVYDLFSEPDMALYLYLRDGRGKLAGLAVLRGLGAAGGFHLDPCIAAPAAAPGVTDLLVVLSMMLLRGAGVAYLSLGYEPYPEMGAIAGQAGVLASLTRWGYRRVVETVQVGGKAAYHDRFYPDPGLASDLYIVVPGGALQIRESAAVMHVANIRLRGLVSSKRPRAPRVHPGEGVCDERNGGKDNSMSTIVEIKS